MAEPLPEDATGHALDAAVAVEARAAVDGKEAPLRPGSPLRGRRRGFGCWRPGCDAVRPGGLEIAVDLNCARHQARDHCEHRFVVVVERDAPSALDRHHADEL